LLEYVLLVVMAFFWAGAFVAGKLSVASVAPEIVAFLRFFTAGVVLTGGMTIWQRGGMRVKRQDWPLVLGLGASGIAAYNLLFFQGLHLAPASDGAMIIPTLNPLITLFASVPLLGERLSRQKLTGAAVSLVGQTLIFGSLWQAAAHDPVRLKGDLLYAGAAICWSTYSILGRIAAKRFTALASTTWATLAGTVMLAPFALWRAAGSTGYTIAFWADVLYMAIFGTVIAFFLWSRGLERLGASRAAVFINLVPVITLVLASVVLGERPASVQVVGMLVVLGGVYLAGTARPTAQAVAR